MAFKSFLRSWLRASKKSRRRPIQRSGRARLLLEQLEARDMPSAVPVFTGPIGQSITTPTIAWTASTGPARYDLWVNDATTGASQVIRQQNLLTNSFTPTTPLTAGHFYRAWVEAFDASGHTAGWSQTLTFSVATVPPPEFTAPTGQTTTAPTITWTPSTGAVRYDLWVNDYTAGISQVIRQQNLTTTSYTPIVPLVAGHMYRAWVEAFDSSGQTGGWSQTLTFATVATVPPTFTAPLGQSMSTPTITWTASSGAVRYDLWVNDASTGASQVIRQQNLTTTSFTPTTPLIAGHMYRAWVEAFNSNGQTGGWSDTLSFAVVPTLAPTFTGPTGITTATPAITWTASTGAVRYDLWVNDFTAGTSQVIRQQNLTTTSFTPTTPLIVGHTYRAWVEAFNSNGQTGGWSDTLTFTVVATMPPTLTAPSGSTVASPTFSWTAASGAASYELWVADDTAGILKLIDQPSLTSTSFTPATPLTIGHQYTAWVQAFDASGRTGGWSQPLSFSAGTPINAGVLHFDFGTSSSPVAAGYTKVTEATMYSPAQGYGWRSGNLQSTDTGSGSALDRAFNYTPDGVFEDDIPNGTYLVTLTIGNNAAAVQDMFVSIPTSGAFDSVPATPAGQFITRTYAVTVSSNQLIIEISDPLAPTDYAVINGLDISLVTLTPPIANLSNNGPINGGSTATVSFSNQAGGTGTYTYSYDFANNGTFEVTNSTSASAVVPASYLSTVGQHVVHGRITDSAGGFNDYTTTINVTTPPATPPVLTSPASLTATQGVATSFGLGSFTDAGASDSPWSVTINWGDSNSTSTVTTAQGALHPTHTYATSGNYTATLTVTNSANASASANIPIAVTPPGPPTDDTAAYIITPFDQIPNFGAHPTVHNVQSGAWSSPSTWSTGVLPTTGAIVSIEPGTTVTYDVVSTAAVNTVIIQNTGSLIFRTDINTELTVVNLLVLQGGTLQVGTQANPVAASVKAQIVFPDQPLNTTLDPAQYGNGLIALGTVTMCGAAMNQTFVTLATEPHAGDTTLTLSQAVTGWNVGDHLILPDTRQLNANLMTPYGTYTPEYEQVTIASISANGTVITLASPLQFDHLGARNEAGVLQYLPQVMDLTRNVVVHSQNPSGTRGQVMFTYQATVDVRYVQFSGLGRTTLSPADNTTFDANGNVTHVGTNEEDRNPIQFRDLFGPATVPADGYQYSFVGNSIFCPLTPMTFIWGININNSDYGLIKNNVLYNWAGAGLVTETGSESFNMIADNMVVRVVGTGQRMDFGRDGLGFWFGGPNNYVVNNVASDISGTLNIFSYGFNLFFEAFYENGGTVLTIPAYQGADPTVSGQSATLNINTSPLLEFSGNETYGATPNGLAFWSLGERDGISIPGGQAGTIENFVVWHQWNYGVFAYYSQNLTIDHFVDLGDPAMIGGAGTGMLFGDYVEQNLVVNNADVEGQVYGITAGVASANSTQTFQNSYLNNIYDFWVQPQTTSQYRADHITPVTYILRNDKFDTPVTTLPTATIEMHMFLVSQLPGLVVNLTAQQQILVYNYNQVAGDNFQVYYAWQVASFVMPQTILNSDGTPQVLGAPVANLTNAQAWAQYGIAMEGAIAPSTATTRAGIDGLINPI